MPDDEPRSQGARAAAELALARVVHHYGGRPEFVLIGGLVPELLCATSLARHAGTTDVDVQVNLEISSHAINAARLEEALRNAGFTADSQHVWRWVATGGTPAVIRFELLADLDSEREEAVVLFNGCDRLGAVNLRGTGLAARDFEIHALTIRDQDMRLRAEINVAGLAGFLMAKAAAARQRRKPKDWYDIAFVLLHNDDGDAAEAAARVQQVFGSEIESLSTTLADLRANFGGPDTQGTRAYVDQITQDHPDIDPVTASADGQLAVTTFCDLLLGVRHP